MIASTDPTLLQPVIFTTYSLVESSPPAYATTFVDAAINVTANDELTLIVGTLSARKYTVHDVLLTDASNS